MSTVTLSAVLPAAAYVSGTVNGVSTIWTNTDGNTWQTTAERSSDDVYRIKLSIVSAAGQTTSASLTLYYGLHLVTDRTEADRIALEGALRAMNEGTATEEQIALASDPTAKGAYNCTDLNRVGAAMEYVADRFWAAGYHVPISPKLDWTDLDAVHVSDAAAYLADLSTLRALIPVTEETPGVPPDMEGLTVAEANDIERILEDLDRLMTNIMAAWVYSGDIYSGEV